MSDELAKRLRDAVGMQVGALPVLIHEAADYIEALESERDALREALEWYGEQARLARLIHSEGDAGRHALAEDGGARARAAINRGNDT